MRKGAIPRGTDLYHGTSVPEDFNIPQGPAWFGDSYAVAKYFSTWHAADGVPRILHFVTTKRIPGLLLIESKEEYYQELGKLAEKTGLTLDADSNSEIVCAAGLNGWIIPNNYPEGADILLCEPEKWLEFVDMTTLKE